MGQVCVDFEALFRGIPDFLADLRAARTSPSDVLAGLESELRTGSIRLGPEPVQPAVNERSRIQVAELSVNYCELLQALGGSIIQLTPELHFVAALASTGLTPFCVEARPVIPVFRFSNPDQTRSLVREAIREEQLLPQLASALAALAAQLVDDLTGRVPIDPSSDEVRALAASAEELAGSFYLLHNQRFGVFSALWVLPTELMRSSRFCAGSRTRGISVTSPRWMQAQSLSALPFWSRAWSPSEIGLLDGRRRESSPNSIGERSFAVRSG